VWVIRSGEVIPYIQSPIVERREFDFCIDYDTNCESQDNLCEVVKFVYQKWFDNFKNNIEFQISDWRKKQIICLKSEDKDINIVKTDNWVEFIKQITPYLKDKNIYVKILPPNKCPICGSDVIKFPDEVYYYCSNINCPAQIKEKLRYFVSKEAMDIS
jgi:NAD-dependent DNA ligase